MELFASCATCHNYRDGRDTFSRPAGWQPTAPDLYRFASRPWLAAFLDPKQISGPRFFGNTKFRRALMPSFVKNTLSKLDERGKAELQDLIAALSAEAGLRSQRGAGRRDAAKIKAGRAALTSFGCTDCHKFRDAGANRRRAAFDRLRFAVVAGGHHQQPGPQAILWHEERPHAGLRRHGRSGQEHFERRGYRVVSGLARGQ